MKNIKRHYPRIMMSAAMLLSSVVLLVVTVAYKAPPSLISSVIVIVLYFGSAIYYGLISIQSIVLAAAYIPSLAFLWAWLGGGNYINSHNHWLQDSVFFVDTSVALVAVSMMVTLSVLLLSSKSHSSRYRITGSVSEINSYLYLVSTILFLFFFSIFFKLF